MSMETPNEYEQALEAYAEATREDKAAYKAYNEAKLRLDHANDVRRGAWKAVRTFVQTGGIKPGFYRLSSSTNRLHCEGLMISKESDCAPEITPMFR